jgi:microcystin-dependent protein
MDIDCFVGQIQLFGFFFAPVDWATCDGQILIVNDYPALFSLLGNQYGGDGRTNFALPNLQGAEPLPNMKYYIALTGTYPTRT